MKRVGKYNIYDNIDFNYLISNKTGHTNLEEDISCIDLTKQLARVLYREFCDEYKSSYAVEFNIDESKFNTDEDIVEFNRGERISAIDFFRSVDLPFTRDFDDNAFDGLCEPEIVEVKERLKFFEEWTCIMELDSLLKCINERDPFISVQYVGLDKSIRTFITHHYKNPDWFEILEGFFGKFLGVSEYFIYFADIDCGELVFDLYKSTTCGIKVDANKRTLTFYDKKTALNAFNNFCSLTHENGWVNQNDSKFYDKRYKDELGCKDVHDAPYCELYKVILGDETVILNIGNVPSDEVANETIRMTENYLERHKGEIVNLNW